ncbi:hypothetical protein ACFOPS_08180 [Ralstonia solanacearum]|uniref:hypothetical protein n=1 Tax=Ralstonia solanacearum TaxID=305 RepID=UPI003623E7FE
MRWGCRAASARAWRRSPHGDGGHVPDPVGLAAGLDKDGAYMTRWARSFGFIEVGTVTPRAQPGNPRPAHVPAAGGACADQSHGLQQRRRRCVHPQRAGIDVARGRRRAGPDIGKNADTPIERAVDDYLHCLERVYPHASYVTVNISSPNTKNLRQLQGASELDSLLGTLRGAQQRWPTSTSAMCRWR